MSNKVVIVIIGIIILLLGAVILFGGDNEEVTASGSNNKIGNESSAVVLKEAYSLGCPSCASHHPVLKQVREEYADRILFQVVHYPLTANFQNARAAHRAVEAAAKQDKFWEMHDVLFENRNLWASQFEISDPIPQIDIFAEEIGLDLEKFKEDFRSAEINNIINEDEKYLRGLLGRDIATPTFILNDEKIVIQTTSGSGIPTFQEFAAVLDEALGVVEDGDESAEDGAESAPDAQPIEGGVNEVAPQAPDESETAPENGEENVSETTPTSNE